MMQQENIVDFINAPKIFYQRLRCENVLAKAHFESQKRIFEVLSHLFESENANLNSDDIYEGFYAREQIGSTALGKGVVLPHCSLATTETIEVAVLTLQEPIIDEATDMPADIFIGLVFPEQQPAAQSFIAQLIHFIKQDAVLQSVRDAETNEALIDALQLTQSDWRMGIFG